MSKFGAVDGAAYVIAEVGANHNGDFELAKKHIDLAAGAGASCVKFQAWSERSLISKQLYEENTTYADKKKHFGSLFEMVQRYKFRDEWYGELPQYCKEKGVEFATTPFSSEEVQKIAPHVTFIKIASCDLDQTSLIKEAASTGLPLVISTGMGDLGEIDAALNSAVSSGCKDLTLLHCVSVYPCAPEEMNLRNIEALRSAFGVPVGLSDHSLGSLAAVIATAMGVRLFEKHFTIDSSLPGWDHDMSASPAEFSDYAEKVVMTLSALGASRRIVGSKEMEKIIYKLQSQMGVHRDTPVWSPLPGGVEPRIDIHRLDWN